jgi:lipoate-protein ligase A
VVDSDRARARDVVVVRRRSGGAAVLVEPGNALWVDVTIPADDPLWDVDVGRAFHWLGQAWVEAIRNAGVDSSWHNGPMLRTAWSPLVCFAGLGPGEVTVDGRKAVGMSQRRTRSSAVFQCCALSSWDPGSLLDLLVLDEPDRRRGERELRDVATGVAGGHDLAGAVVDVISSI